MSEIKLGNTSLIYERSKSAMQSAPSCPHPWVLEFIAPQGTEPQEMYFQTLDAAITFAKQQNMDYKVVKSEVHHRPLKAYDDRFKTSD
jgi:hypothetical protein